MDNGIVLKCPRKNSEKRIFIIEVKKLTHEEQMELIKKMRKEMKLSCRSRDYIINILVEKTK